MCRALKLCRWGVSARTFSLFSTNAVGAAGTLSRPGVSAACHAWEPFRE